MTWIESTDELRVEELPTGVSRIYLDRLTGDPVIDLPEPRLEARYAPVHVETVTTTLASRGALPRTTGWERG